MNEEEFAFRVRQALNEGAERVDYRTGFQLEQARNKALGRLRRTGPATVRLPALQAATAGGLPGQGGGPWAWLRGAGLVAPLVALGVGFMVISDWQNERQIEHLAALDFAVLLDDGPLDAYADEGFGAFLQSELGSR
jgi:hypothetical protein